MEVYRWGWLTIIMGDEEGWYEGILRKKVFEVGQLHKSNMTPSFEHRNHNFLTFLSEIIHYRTKEVAQLQKFFDFLKV